MAQIDELRPGDTGRVSLAEIARSFLKVGAVGFGGGVGMLALLRNEVVERKHWIDDRQLGVAVTLGQMLPGPFVSNYAEYVGYQLRGWQGMAVAGLALLAPCFILMVGLSILYFRFGSVPLVMRVFAGVQPVVVGILAWATYTIGRANLRSRRSVLIAAIAALALFFRGDILLVVIGCGILGIVLSARNTPAASGLVLLLPALLGVTASAPSVLARAGELALVFFKVGTVIFGGGFAAIPFLQHEVVDVRQWLTMREFIDGVALGQITPGPVAITAAFIGYKVLGVPGALVAAAGTFLPSGLMLWGVIRVYHRIESNTLVQRFLSGIMPAVTGMLLVTTVAVGRSAITGPVQAVVAPLALTLLLRFRPDPVWLVLAGGVVGLVSA
ncbi:MAG: chromate efflux transporter [candidate division WOR-3 bacterium]